MRAFYRLSTISPEGQEAVLEGVRQPCGHEALSRDQQQERRDDGSAGPQDHQLGLSRNPESEDRTSGSGRERSRRRFCRRRRDRYVDWRSSDRSQPRADPDGCRAAWPTPASRRFEVFFPERDEAGNVISSDPAQRCGEESERRAARNLPQAAPGRSADAGHRHAAVPGHVLRSRGSTISRAWAA